MAGTGNTIAGNYIGTDYAAASAHENVNGLLLNNGASSNTIGGTVAGSRNVISGNSGAGIYLSGSGSDNNLIQGNYIGINGAGTAVLANNDGVWVSGGAGSTPSAARTPSRGM